MRRSERAAGFVDAPDILVAFMAYAMWKTLEKWMEGCGLGNGPRTVMDEMRRIKCCEVVLPTDAGREAVLECVTKPDGHQNAILQRLKLEVPIRLSRPRWSSGLKLDLKCSADPG